jgi:triosephosphate isomerase (TIM)
MKQYLIAGNWKMNTNVFEAVELTKHILLGLKKRTLPQNVKVLVCPPYTNLDSVSRELKYSKILLGAQNCHFEPKGAFTGEIAIVMLKQFECQYVIIGHSERRHIFGEKNDFINKKARALLNHQVSPILCIGESLEQRNAGETNNVLEEQLVNCLKDISSEEFKNIVIAYEPVWAIGTGISATNEQIDTAHNFIRNLLNKLYGDVAKDTLLLYGGSVTADNAQEILLIKNVNGALIGGAALKYEQFLSIIDYSISI